MKVAFVAPFYGAQASGGAESECRNTALRLARSGVAVDVWTTCALDLVHGWQAPHHPEGVTVEDGVTVRRFAALPKHEGWFCELNNRLIAGRTLTREEEEQFMAMHACSPGLLRGLAAACADYRWVCFIPYLFSPAVHGTRLCPDRAILIPCLHDEGYARMAMVREMFGRVARVVFHSRAEQDLAGRLYGLPATKSLLVGEGVETRFESVAGRFREKYGIRDPFLLYAGRKDAAKNVPFLLQAFAAYRRARGGRLKLVMIGPSEVPIPADLRGEILDLGFVPDADKKDAYSAAWAFCQPSLNESFSIVMMEAWICGVPCLVHGDCAVTREHVVRSGGGLYFRTAAEFAGCLDCWQERPELMRQMGACGRQYVLSEFEWDHIVERYRQEVLA